jgi:hypothetical protein
MCTALSLIRPHRCTSFHCALAVRFGELGAGRLSSSLRMRGWEIGTWRLRPQGTSPAKHHAIFFFIKTAF